MKKFKYRLEALLKVKQHIEREKQKDLAKVRQRVLKQKQEIKQIEQAHKQVLNGKREKQSDRLSVAELLVYSRYLLKLKGDTLNNRELLRGLQKTESEKRDLLIQAVKERKTYEKLKERQREQFNKEIATLEMKEGDEIGLNSHRQKTKHTKS